MMGRSDTPSTLDGSSLATHKDHLSMLEPVGFAIRGVNQNSSNNRPRRGHTWCDHYKKHGHVKETCWKLQGKPPDWKPIVFLEIVKVEEMQPQQK